LRCSGHSAPAVDPARSSDAKSVVCVSSECRGVGRGKALGRSWTRSRRHVHPEVFGSQFRHEVLPHSGATVGEGRRGVWLREGRYREVSPDDHRVAAVRSAIYRSPGNAWRASPRAISRRHGARKHPNRTGRNLTP
jgi:hypothetical protein